MKPLRKYRALKVVLIGGTAIVGLWSCNLLYKIIRWKAYIWLPGYLAAREIEPTDATKHVIFLMADHFEPGSTARGAEKARAWLSRFRPIADGHHDSYGNRFRYTWFYPYDHKNEAVLAQLSEIAHQGYGEVELHWHLPMSANSETFPSSLDEAVAWFRRYGALVTEGPRPETHFGFIAGNWALDGARRNSHKVYNQLQTLLDRGCYADFTFSTIGTEAQPRKINSIYYARDTASPKSYDTGVDSRVGSQVKDALLMIQGPLAMDMLTGTIEYGAVESYERPSPRRIRKWIDANIHVKGRPEWIFIKVYTHGCQSEEELLGHDLDAMLTWLEGECRGRGHQLHFMTAREAFNVVKAAEAGMTGDPEHYRDFQVGRPLNSTTLITSPIRIGTDKEGKSSLTLETLP